MTYPGRVPSTAYVLHGGDVHQSTRSEFASTARGLGISLEGRIAVLASGSNAAPARLADKCGRLASIPVALVEAVDTAVVYSAHISRYGSIPANRVRHGGSSTMVHVPMLNDDQLAIVDASEGSYRRVPLDGPFAAFLGPVFAYESWRGLLYQDGYPVRVEEVPARCELRSCTQIEALDLVASRTGAAPDGETLSQLVASGDVEADDINRILIGD